MLMVRVTKTLSERFPMALGRPATIPVKIKSDMPLPMPRAVICSPSHIMKMEPVVSVNTVVKRNIGPGFVTSGAPSEFGGTDDAGCFVSQRDADHQDVRFAEGLAELFGGAGPTERVRGGVDFSAAGDGDALGPESTE